MTINELLAQQPESERLSILSAYLKALGKLHKHRKAGSIHLVSQGSAHPGNQLTIEQGITEDNIDIEANLTSCLSRLYPRYDRYLPSVWDSYLNSYLDSYLNTNKGYSNAHSEGKTFCAAPTYEKRESKRFFTEKKGHHLSLTQIEKTIYKKRKAREKNLANCFIDNNRYQIEKTWNHFQVIQKEYDSTELRELLSAPDKVIETGTLLKDCPATTVSICQMSSGKKVILKRYNSKGTLYSLTRSLINSRARVCWKGALLLNQIGIKTPNNLAMLELKSGPWVKTSYLITEFIEGQTLSSLFYNTDKVREPAIISREVADILHTFPRVHVAHGDLKSTNFIVSNNTVSMIDLDSIHSFMLPTTFKKSYLQDINRFEHNWVHSPIAEKLFSPTIQDIRDQLLYI